MKVSIAQSTFEEIHIEIVIWLAIFARIEEEFVIVAICEIKTFVVVTSDYTVVRGGEEGG